MISLIYHLFLEINEENKTYKREQVQELIKTGFKQISRSRERKVGDHIKGTNVKTISESKQFSSQHYLSVNDTKFSNSRNFVSQKVSELVTELVDFAYAESKRRRQQPLQNHRFQVWEIQIQSEADLFDPADKFIDLQSI